MNRKTSCITDEQFTRIIGILGNGEGNITKNIEMALILTITGNCGLRIGDCLNLRLSSFMRERNGYRYNIIEEKTGKHRTTLIPDEIFKLIQTYALKTGRADERIFNTPVRTLQWKLQQIAKYLGDDYKDVSTHSFRKHAAMNVYRKSGNDIELTRKFLNHSSVSTTQRYLGVDDDDINDILKDNYSIPFAM